MKKLLIFCLVLSTAPCALAVPVFRVDPANMKDHYAPSEVITIQLYDSGQVTGFAIDAIVDIYADGTALEPQVLNAGFGYRKPGILNYDGKLVAFVAANVTSYTTPFPTGILYSFEYHVPYTQPSVVFGIETFADGENYLDPYIYYADGSYYEGHIDGPFFHLNIPEPATLALLGLGALMLRRRK